MSNEDNDIDWGREILSRISSSGENTIQKISKQNFKKYVCIKALSETINNYRRPQIQKLLQIAELKIKLFNGVEKGLGIANSTEFKVGSAKVGLMDSILLSNDLMTTWVSSDKNVWEKLEQTAKNLSGFSTGFIVSEAGMGFGAKIGGLIGTEICPGVGSAIGGFLGGLLEP